jgi:hypothetical protein
MTWNYRVMQHADQFAIHEVFYKPDGSVEGYTQTPVFPRAESLEELRQELERYSSALDEPVLQFQSP